jgi:hypothetical protein
MSVHHLAFERGDNKLITPRELVEKLLMDIDQGKCKPDKLLIITQEPLENGRNSIGYYASNVDRSEHVSLCELSKLQVIEDWKS